MLLAFDAPDSTHVPADLPAANLRNVVVANEVLRYRLQRVRRRTIGFQINDTGLTIRAPRSITLREIEAAIVKNHQWIRTKQVAWRAWRAQQQRAVPCLNDGGAVKYLGQTATLRLTWGAAIDATSFDADTNEVRLALPAARCPTRATMTPCNSGPAVIANVVATARTRHICRAPAGLRWAHRRRVLQAGGSPRHAPSGDRARTTAGFA